LIELSSFFIINDWDSDKGKKLKIFNKKEEEFWFNIKVRGAESNNPDI